MCTGDSTCDARTGIETGRIANERIGKASRNGTLDAGTFILEFERFIRGQFTYDEYAETCTVLVRMIWLNQRLAVLPNAAVIVRTQFP